MNKEQLETLKRIPSQNHHNATSRKAGVCEQDNRVYDRNRLRDRDRKTKQWEREY